MLFIELIEEWGVQKRKAYWWLNKAAEVFPELDKRRKVAGRHNPLEITLEEEVWLQQRVLGNIPRICTKCSVEYTHVRGESKGVCSKTLCPICWRRAASDYVLALQKTPEGALKKKMYQKEYMKKYIREYSQREDVKEKRESYYQREDVKERQKLYYASEDQREKKKKRNQQYFQRPEVKERLKGYLREYFKKLEVRERMRESNNMHQRRRMEDPLKRLRQSMSSQLSNSLKRQNTTKKNKTMQYVGCTKEFLKEHLESQFTDGMTWENRKEWHIDHYVPCAFFDFSSDEEIFISWNYRNLRPMWASENISKRDSLPPDTLDRINEICDALQITVPRSILEKLHCNLVS
jgi:hypothetical protein